CGTLPSTVTGPTGFAPTSRQPPPVATSPALQNAVNVWTSPGSSTSVNVLITARTAPGLKVNAVSLGLQVAAGASITRQPLFLKQVWITPLESGIVAHAIPPPSTSPRTPTPTKAFQRLIVPPFVVLDAGSLLGHQRPREVARVERAQVVEPLADPDQL